MSKIMASIMAFSTTIIGATARPSALQSRAATGNFSLFAYGSHTDSAIGGYPIFYNEGFAYIANPAKVNDTDKYVTFTPGTDDETQWLASPLTTSNNTWAESLLYVPTTSGPAGFYKSGISNTTQDSIFTTGFAFYSTAAMINIGGSLYTEWYALQTSVDGLWSVGWNATGAGETDAELIIVTRVSPANVQYPIDK